MAKPDDKLPASRRRPASPAEPAFDAWLKRGLHQMFDDVASEPIPEELLRLIEEDRSK
ncbi:MAG: NepR family anti-sigma factor [Janthinobacterium lividum]